MGKPLVLAEPRRVRIASNEEAYYHGEAFHFDVEVLTQSGKGTRVEVEPHIYRGDPDGRLPFYVMDSQTVLLPTSGTKTITFDTPCTFAEGEYILNLELTGPTGYERWGRAQFRFKVKAASESKPPSLQPVSISVAQGTVSERATRGFPMSVKLEYTLSKTGTSRDITLQARARHSVTGQIHVLGEKTISASAGGHGTVDFSQICQLEPGDYTVQFYTLEGRKTHTIAGVQALGLRVQAPSPIRYVAEGGIAPIECGKVGNLRIRATREKEGEQKAEVALAIRAKGGRELLWESPIQPVELSETKTVLLNLSYVAPKATGRYELLVGQRSKGRIDWEQPVLVVELEVTKGSGDEDGKGKNPDGAKPDEGEGEKQKAKKTNALGATQYTLSLYPNPAKNQLYIRGLGESQSVSIFSQVGRLLLSAVVRNGEGLDISSI